MGLGARHDGLDAGIGVACGTVVAGRVGADERYEYTVLGGPVNAAARLTDLAKGRAARVLASSVTVGAPNRTRRARWVAAGVLELRGVAEPLAVLEPAPT